MTDLTMYQFIQNNKPAIGVKPLKKTHFRLPDTSIGGEVIYFIICCSNTATADNMFISVRTKGSFTYYVLNINHFEAHFYPPPLRNQF